MANLDLTQLPSKVTIENISTAVQPIQFYRNSLSITIEAGDSVLIRATTSSELAYYIAQESDALSVDFVAIEEEA